MENESKEPEFSGNWLSETKNWIQDNIRIVLSIVIVLAIALGVYSYSNRGVQKEEQLAKEETEEISLEQLTEEKEQQLTEEEKAKIMEEAKKISQEEKDAVEEEVIIEEEATEETQPVIEEEVIKEETEMEEATEEIVVEEEKATEEEPQITTAPDEEKETVVSQDKGGYEVTAAQGDSLTTMARVAVKQYLDNNKDSSLSKEQKVYIEDYLAKKMGYSNNINIGEAKSFQSSDIAEAINTAKTLTPDQLDHLKIYSQRVSNL